MTRTMIFQTFQSLQSKTLTMLGTLVAFCSYICFWILRCYGFNGKYVLFMGLCIGLSLLIFGVSKIFKGDEAKFLYRPAAFYFIALPLIYLFNIFFDSLIESNIPGLTLFIPILVIIYYLIKKICLYVRSLL